ncbi:hypothetical protein IFM89_037412, partial [Coptis chinensis]
SAVRDLKSQLKPASVQQYPKSKKFRNKPLEYANELRTLFEGTVANRDNALVSARKKLPIDVPHSEHESSRTDAPGDPTASEQGAQSDIGTSHSSGKRKRKTTSEDVDMKAEVRDLICLIKDQVVSGKAKEGPSLDDCTQVMNELLHGGSINMRVYHGALLKFCECENYRKAFMGMESLEHRIFFLTTMARRLLLDPAIHEEFTRLKTLVEEKEKKVKELQDNVAAVNFTTQSRMGKMLMAKCRTLQEENEEIGALASEGKIHELAMKLASQKSQNAELRSQFEGICNYMEGLTNDVERSNEMVLCLQHSLEEKDAELRRLKLELNQKELKTEKEDDSNDENRLTE